MVFPSRDIRIGLQHRSVNSVGSPSLESRLRVHWLEALVSRFGADAVASWRSAPPGWGFAEWRARVSSRTAHRRAAL